MDLVMKKVGNLDGIFGGKKMNTTKNLRNDGYKLNDVIGLVGINYNIELNEYQSNLIIKFVTKNNDELCIKFNNISSLNLNEIGGKYNQLESIEIIENKSYEKNKKYYIRDYENQMIDFYCESYLIITNENY